MIKTEEPRPRPWRVLNFENWDFDIVSDFDIRIFNFHTIWDSQDQ